jgi:hypothetical protein
MDEKSTRQLYKDHDIVKDITKLFGKYEKCKTDEIVHGIMCMKRKIPYGVAVDTVRKYIKTS